MVIVGRGERCASLLHSVRRVIEKGELERS